jgi:hypothetical protein
MHEAATIIKQIIDPEHGGFSPELAKYVLSLSFLNGFRFAARNCPRRPRKEPFPKMNEPSWTNSSRRMLF